MVEIIPGIQTSDGFEAKHKVDLLEGRVPWFHIDICDGVFVPSQTIWATDVRLIRPRVPFHLHLMTKINEEVIDDFASTDADTLFFYPRAADNPKMMIQISHDLGKKVGLVLDLNDSIGAVTPFLKEIDYTLVMTVKSGFANQRFHPEVLAKVTNLRQLASNIKIGVDGGIKVGTASLAAKVGADFMVVNSAVWQEPDLQEAIENLRKDAIV